MNESTQLDVRNYSALELSFQESKNILSKQYLNHLQSYEVARMPLDLQEMELAEFTRIYEISKLVYTKDESMIEKLITVLNAVYFSNSTLVSIISSSGNKPRFFIGVVNKHHDSDTTSTAGSVFYGSFRGNFNGSGLSLVKGTNLNKILTDLQDSSVVSAISSVPSPREESSGIENYVQGIEKLIDSLQGRKYTIITVADAVENSQCSTVKSSLEQLYTDLSGFSKTDLSINESSSQALSDTYSDSFAKSIGTNTSLSQSHTSQTGWSYTDSHGETKTKNPGGAITAGFTAAAVTLTVATGGAALLAASAIGATGAVTGNLLGSKSDNHNFSDGKSGSESSSDTMQRGNSDTDTKTESYTKGTTETDTHGRNIQFSVENRAVKSLLDDIDEQIKRLKICESYGAFSSSTYVLTDDIATNIQVSGNFNALLRGENSHVQNSYINTWGIEDSNEERQKVDAIKGYILKLTHPIFKPTIDAPLEFSPASLVSSKELAIQVGLPKKSITGLTVVESAAFGRNTIVEDSNKRSLELGSLYHMGQKDQFNEVMIDVDSLCSHTFITGSTGAGKSNTIYNLLSKLAIVPYGIKFLVIESAKGEYKHAFSKHPLIKAHVYGTNPKKAPLLRINPFKFPDDIHILEHIDRLIEIFNVCWPMYAAMPAILKDSVERAYGFCGWDLEASEFNCQYSNQVIYPTFADVLEQIEMVLNESSYSADNKGDYTGALSTRIKSLTNGINGQIFTTNDLSDEELFDDNVIIDLSRVGSTETKSLIMGILVIKLQEYRMASNYKPNQPLRHVTVLEEAHNLLKRTSTEQSSEGSNLLGKSVEMLSNAIAEMRTYGEGFIIADQAPGLLDMSVIRNTNTKIIMRLPDKDDRELVGKSANLNDSQVVELAKLEKGVAAIYQNDWHEPVLCKFEKYTKDAENPHLDELLFEYLQPDTDTAKVDFKLSVIRYLLSNVVKAPEIVTENELHIMKRKLMSSNLSGRTKVKVLQALNKKPANNIEAVSEAVVLLYNTNSILEAASSAINMDDWNKKIIQKIDPNLSRMSHWYIDAFLQCVIIEQTQKMPEFLEYAEKWTTYMRGRDIL